MPVDTVLYNAKLYVEGRILEGGLAVDNGKIVRIAKEANLPSATRRVDLRRLLVLPGIIDAHVHLRDQLRSPDEDFYTGTSAAVAGGITTVLDMPNNIPVTMSAASLRKRMQLAEPSILADVGFFSAFPENIEAIDEVVKEGAIAFKLYLTEQIGGLNIDDDKLLSQAFKKAGELDVPVAVHAEDRRMVEDAVEAERKQGKNDVKAYLRAHSPEVEAEAVGRILGVAYDSNAHIHFCHISSKKSIILIHNARNKGLRVSCEATPHHLLLSNEKLRKLGTLALTDPPFRNDNIRNELWDAVKEAKIDIVASDHAPHLMAHKVALSVWNMKPGVPGLETMLSLLLTKVNEGQLTLGEVVRLTAEKPAEIFQLRGRGFLKEGYIANLTVVDMHQQSRVDPSQFYSKAKYSPFEGWSLKGLPVRTFINGCQVMKEGEIVADYGTGRILRKESPT
ncbi:dihydroorotase [Candidatus Bathyarchaeota archaeon]|nr:MAG: dihydroorotase [Candidatus Bathyarchaeota archaeon]